MALTHVLLFFHLLGAVSFFAGAAVAGTLQLAAIRRERPSEIYALLRLAPAGAAFVGIGALLTLGFGIALAELLERAHALRDPRADGEAAQLGLDDEQPSDAETEQGKREE